MTDSVGDGDIANLLSERIPATIQFINDHDNQIAGLELALKPYTPTLVNLMGQLENLTLNTTCGSASTIGDTIGVDPGIIAREALMAEAARLVASVAAPNKELKFFSYWKKYDTLEKEIKKATGIENEADLPSIVTSAINILQLHQNVDGEPINALWEILKADMTYWKELNNSVHHDWDEFFLGQ